MTCATTNGHITHDLRDAKISHTLGLYIPGLYVIIDQPLGGEVSSCFFHPLSKYIRVQNKQKRNEIIHKTKERLSPYWYNTLEASYNMFNCFRILFSNFVCPLRILFILHATEGSASDCLLWLGGLLHFILAPRFKMLMLMEVKHSSRLMEFQLRRTPFQISSLSPNFHHNNT